MGVLRDWKNSNGVRVVSIERISNDVHWRYERIMPEKHYDVKVDWYGFDRSYEIRYKDCVCIDSPCFGQFMNALLYEMNAVSIDNESEAEAMFKEANYMARSTIFEG